MSEGNDYAERVVGLSTQLADARAEVAVLRKRIRAVDEEHEQLKKDRADLAERFDAALRRAKAEERVCKWKYDDIDDFHETQCDEGYCCNGTLDEHKIKFCPFCGGTIQLDARAAQIEQGE